jgi:hypothetical protein
VSSGKHKIIIDNLSEEHIVDFSHPTETTEQSMAQTLQNQDKIQMRPFPDKEIYRNCKRIPFDLLTKLLSLQVGDTRIYCFQYLVDPNMAYSKLKEILLHISDPGYLCKLIYTHLMVHHGL